MSEDKIRYFLRERGRPWREVIKDEWLQAEYDAGFRGGRMLGPSTAAWSAGNWEGYVDYAGTAPEQYMPLKACRYGLTRAQALEVVGAGNWDVFCAWVAGQTIALCQGERCPEPHGAVFYPGDVEWFLMGLSPLD